MSFQDTGVLSLMIPLKTKIPKEHACHLRHLQNITCHQIQCDIKIKSSHETQLTGFFSHKDWKIVTLWCKTCAAKINFSALHLYADNNPHFFPPKIWSITLFLSNFSWIILYSPQTGFERQLAQTPYSWWPFGQKNCTVLSSPFKLNYIN